jgi:NAD(P)H-flavin reductase
MRIDQVEVTEQVLFPEGPAVRFSNKSILDLLPGQYLLASAQEDILPTPLFLQGREANDILTTPNVPSHWHPGTRLLLQGPLGKGFAIPVEARHIILAGFCDAGYRLFPLLPTTSRAGRTVTFFVDTSPPDLPKWVEVLPLDMLAENLAWADYVALDLCETRLPEIRSHLKNAKPPTLKMEVLIRTPLACGGKGDCGLCVVHTKKGLRYACEHGPVFNWSDLVEE